MGRVSCVALALATVAVAVTAVAGARTPTRSVQVAGSVAGLGADGVRAAIGVRRRGCSQVVVWTRTTRSLTALGRPRCEPSSSTGSGILGPSLAGTRALWVTYVGGNIREWSLWTASTRRRTPRRLGFEAQDVELPSPFVLGEGDATRSGDLLPYAVGDVLVVLRSSGARAFTRRASGRVAAVASKGGEVAFAVGRTVQVVDRERTIAAHSFPATVERVFITGNAVLAQYGRTIARRGAGESRTWTLPAGARLVDAEGNLAAYVVGGSVHVLRLDDRKDVAWASPFQRAFGQLEPAGLLIGAGRRITLVPRARVLALLNR